MDMYQPVTVEAEPYPFEFVPAQCALLIIDMQRDFGSRRFWRHAW
jgi:hypothetical protein